LLCHWQLHAAASAFALSIPVNFNNIMMLPNPYMIPCTCVMQFAHLAPTRMVLATADHARSAPKAATAQEGPSDREEQQRQQQLMRWRLEALLCHVLLDSA
jgi:hypothetical protein